MVDLTMNEGVPSSNTIISTNYTDYPDYTELLSAIFKLNLTFNMDGMEYDYNVTDMTDTLDDYLLRICQRQTGQQGRPSGLGASAAERTSNFGFIIEGVLLTAVSVFGLVGNIVAIIVLSRYRHQPPNFN
jgi:hypothetical protein